MSASMDENNVTLEFTILDFYPFRSMLEILKGYKDLITLQFWPDRMEISASNEKKNLTHRYVIHGNDILHYRYPCKVVNGQQVPVCPHISLETKASEILNLTKSNNRVDTLNATTTINLSESTSPGIYITALASSRSLPLAKLITIYSCTFTEPNLTPDYYEAYYKHRAVSFPGQIDRPGLANSRISVTAFSKAITDMKTSGCDRLVFSLTETKHIELQCFRGPTFLVGTTLPESGIDISYNQYARPNNVIDCGDDMTIIDGDEQYEISYDVANIEWLEKIEKLSKMSVLDIYMEQGYPLVLRTKIGFYGIATFALSG